MTDPRSEKQHILSSEAAHFDREYSRLAEEVSFAVNPRIFAYYSHPRNGWRFREQMARWLGPMKEKTVLDMGCGIGEEAAYFAKLGAIVTAIDISPEGIRQTAARARHNGLSIAAQVADCTQTGLPSNHFDLIHGIGVIHHVGIEAGLQEAYRLLKPGGRAVFSEHMSNSRFLDILRQHYNGESDKSDDERPLTWNECRAMQSKYSLRMEPWSLLYRLRRPFPALKNNWTLRFDYAILRLCPPLRHFAGSVLIELTK